MLDVFRELNNYTNFLPKNIKANVNKEKYEILNEIKRIVFIKKKNSYNVASVIKLFNTYEVINTKKYKSFHFYIFMIRYLWNSLQDKSISPNLKCYICQCISTIFKNIKKYILYDFFFEYDRKLILKEENGKNENVNKCMEPHFDKGITSDCTNNSYAYMSENYYDEYQNLHEESEVDSSINDNKLNIFNDVYVTCNGIYEKNKKNEDETFLNEEVIINGKDESFRLYIQKCIFNIIDYKYLFNLLYEYLSNYNNNNNNNNNKHDEFSHNAYKSYMGAILNLLNHIKYFCYYNIDVHNLLVEFALNNDYSYLYEEYVDSKNKKGIFSEEDYFDKNNVIFLINRKLNERKNIHHNNDDYNTNCDEEYIKVDNIININKDGQNISCDISEKNTNIKSNDNIMNEYDNSLIEKRQIENNYLNIDKSVCDIKDLEVCTRYNTIFLNYVLLSQLSSHDLCFKLIKYKKVLYLYKKIRRFNWNCINYAFVNIIYKGLKYAYIYNLNIENEMQEILHVIYFLFLFYIKLPSNVKLNSSKHFIPEDYNLLVNDNESVVKVISKIFVFLLNKKYRKGNHNPSNKNEKNSQELLYKFLSTMNEKNFTMSEMNTNNSNNNFMHNDTNDNNNDNNKDNNSYNNNYNNNDNSLGENFFPIFTNIDTYEYLNIITSLFMPHIHPSNIGKHIGNINLFINSFLYCFIRKMKREEIYLKQKNKKTELCKEMENNKINGNSHIDDTNTNNEYLEPKYMNDYVNNYFIMEDDKKFVIEKFMALAVQGMFPKSNKGISLFENILKHLCIIDINCLDIFVKKIMDCLMNVNISTQICNCLLSLCLLLPLLIKYKSKYLKDILYVMNMGIDICDVYKSFTIFSFLSILFSYISIVKLDSCTNDDYSLAIDEYKKMISLFSEDNKKMLNNEDIKKLLTERKELIDYLCYWVYEFFDKIMYFIKFSKSQKSKDSKKQNGDNKDNKIENDLYTGLKTTIISLFIHLDHEIVYDLSQRFLNNIELENSKFLSIIPYAISLVDNKKIFDLLFNAFYKKLITKKKKKRTIILSNENNNMNKVNNETSKNIQTSLESQELEEYYVYTKNEYANDDTVKCYLQFLSSLMRRAKNEFLNVEDIYQLIKIYIVEDNIAVFKYICKIIYRFLEYNFSVTIMDYSCFPINEKMSNKEKLCTTSYWGIPWHVIVYYENIMNHINVSPNQINVTNVSLHRINDTNVSPNQINDTNVSPNQINDTNVSPHQINDTDVSPNQINDTDVSPNQINDTNVSPNHLNDTNISPNHLNDTVVLRNQSNNRNELIKWKTPLLKDVKVGKKFIFFLLDYLIDLLIQCDIPVNTPNIVRYIEKRKLGENRRKIEWKFSLTYANVISRIYKVIKCIIKPTSFLYPDERYNYNNLLTKCHVINSKLSFFLYVYISEIVITLSLRVLRIPSNILDMSTFIRECNDNEEKTENSSNEKIVQNMDNRNELKKLKEEFYRTVINNREKDIKADAKVQRKMIKNIHFLLLKCNENPNSSLYNEYINNVLSFTYNIYPYSYNYDIIKSQYINNIFYLFNERLKQRKKNYAFRGFRKQLCNILFYINLSIYSQVRSYSQNTIKLILPSFKMIKTSFLKTCAFYLKNYIKLYLLTKGDILQNKKTLDDSNDGELKEQNMKRDVINKENMHIEKNYEEVSAVQNTSEHINNTEFVKESNIHNEHHNNINNVSINKWSTLKSLNDLNNNDYFENKCISSFNGIIVSIINNMGLIKKISTDVTLLKKFLKVIIRILRLDIQKEDITMKCMKLVYSIINNRFIKKSVEEKKKKKKINKLFLCLKEESEKKNNIYSQIVIMSFLICFNYFVIDNHCEFYFNYLIENLSIKKNVHVYNLAFCGFIKMLKYLNDFHLKGVIPKHIALTFETDKIYKNIIDICIYKNFKNKKKNNSMNAIIINLSKIQKPFKGFTQISETCLKDFYSYYVFFEFLVNIQNAYFEEMQEKEARLRAMENLMKEENYNKDLTQEHEEQNIKENDGEHTVECISTHNGNNKGKSIADHINKHNLEEKEANHISCNEDMINHKTSDADDNNNQKESRNDNTYTENLNVKNCKLKYIEMVLIILKELQMDIHYSDNEYKCAFISLLCPLLLSLKNLRNKEEAEDIIKVIVNLLEKEIAMVNIEVFNVWIYCFHLLFINIKKKYIHLYNKLFDFCLTFNVQDISNVTFKKKMQLFDIMLLYSLHKNVHILDNSLMNFVKLVENDNIAVRQVIGDVFCYILYVLYDNKHYEHLKCMYYNILLFLYTSANKVIAYLQENSISLSKQSKYIYILETYAYLTLTAFNNKCMYVFNNLSIIFLKMFMLSFQLVDVFINGLVSKAINCFLCPSLYLFKFDIINCSNNNIQIYDINNNNDNNLNNMCLPDQVHNLNILLEHDIGTLVIKNISDLINKSNWKIRNCALHFCYYFHLYYCIFFYNKKENAFLLNMFISLLVDSYIEIQNLSRDILSSVFCYYDNKTLQMFSSYFLSLVNDHKNLQKLPSISKETSLKIIDKKKTVSIYALISIVNSFPNYIPPWLPNILISVAKLSNSSSHVIKKEIEKCIQNFLRTHKDEWEYKYKQIFTEEQLNILDLYKGELNYFT
ncbi:conserved Plasmodium protein, unknown function [Plasmodium sp. gorilla clade G3]|nr:conserved Plasmodium protein, unknown function [Plasmodium sp. gorilla clade G3]